MSTLDAPICGCSSCRSVIDRAHKFIAELIKERKGESPCHITIGATIGAAALIHATMIERTLRKAGMDEAVAIVMAEKVNGEIYEQIADPLSSEEAGALVNGHVDHIFAMLEGRVQ